jgi:hypothetical protein
MVAGESSVAPGAGARVREPSPELASENQLFHIPSRSPSPEDLLEGLKLGDHLTAAVLKMERNARRKRIAELKKCLDYELEREDNILRNRQLMEGLGLNKDIFAGMPTRSKKKTHSSRSKPTEDDDDNFNGDNHGDDDTLGNSVEDLGGTRGRRSARLALLTRDDSMPSEGNTNNNNEQGSDDAGSTVPATSSHSIPEAGALTADGLHAFVVSRFPFSTMVGAHAIKTTWAFPNKTSGVVDRAILCTRGTAKDILAYVNRTDWPDWLTKYFDYLTVLDLGQCWGVAIALWTDLERTYGFQSSVSTCFFASLAH